MSVSPNTGDASLNSIADQINRLERDPNATPEYDNALDAWFAAIEAQRLEFRRWQNYEHFRQRRSCRGWIGRRRFIRDASGNDIWRFGRNASGPAIFRPGSWDGIGGGGSGGTDSDGSPSVDDSVAKLSTTVNPETGDAVKKIADDADKSIGGTDGDTVARMSAEAGERAAAKDIAEGRPQDASKDAKTAAQAVADAGKLAGPEAAKSVATIAATAGPDAAMTSTNKAEKVVEDIFSTFAGLVTGASAFAAVVVAVGLYLKFGASVATSAAAAGASPEEVALATAAALDGAGDAAIDTALSAVGLTAAQQTVLFTLVEQAFSAGGPGLASATTRIVTRAFAAGSSTEDVTGLADTAQFAFSLGGIGAADTAVATAVNVLDRGGTVTDARNAEGIVANAAETGGAPLAQSVGGLTATVLSEGGSVHDASDLAITARDAFRVGGQGAADAAIATAVDVLNSGRSVADAKSAESIVVDGARNAFNAAGGVGGGAAATAAGAQAARDFADRMPDILAASDRAEVGGNSAVADLFGAARNVVQAGGTADQVVTAAQAFAEGIEIRALTSGRDAATSFADEIASDTASATGDHDRASAIVETIKSDSSGASNSSPPPSPADPTPRVSTPDGQPLHIGESEGPTDLKQKLLSADYNKLSDDLKSGADKATIAKDAQQVAILASGFGATGLEQVALIIGSGGTVSSDRDNADALSVVSPDADAAYVSLGSRGTPTSDAYLQLELDIAGNADPQKIKQDADNLAQLANGSGDTALASVATGISNSISDHSYDQSGSLTALMNNSPASGSGSPTPPSQTPPPSDVAAYNKLQADMQSGADEPTLIADAAQLAIAAAGAGDTGLEAVAHNIGNSVGNGTYSKDGSLSALSNAAPGTAGARTAQPPLSSDAAGGAYLKLENDIEHGVDQKTVQADAEQVKALAQQDGNTHLVDAANAIITGIGNGSYDQVGAEEALMNDGTTPEDDAGSFSPDENSAYQKLISDIRSGADNTTLMNDVLSLSEASIQNGDFGTGQAALDIGFAIKGGTFDPNAALQALNNTSPGTSAARLPPIATPNV